jgi:electron transport complex protein RnfC
MGQGIRIAPLPRQVRVPLDLTAMRVAEAIVAPGDSILTGQVIARFPGPGGNAICAPVTGRVRDIAPCPVPVAGNYQARCISIDTAGEDRWSEDCKPLEPAGSLSRENLQARIARAGIVGLGGALFPTADKLRTRTPVNLLILNGAECEPYITCDEMLMRDRPERVIHGAAIMLRALGARQAVIAVESDMPEARLALKAALAETDEPGIGVAVVTAKYPAGGERQLIELLTGQEVPLGGLPGDLGIVCQNVATAAAVSDLFRQGRPLISRIVTVTGNGIGQPGNFEVRLGTPLRELIAAAGGYAQPDCQLYMGGPMMGIALDSDELPVTEASNCLIVSTPEEMAAPRPEFPCIRCGECSRVCPARLMPQDLLIACMAGDAERQAALQVDACIECGCCDYVCPSQIALTARFVQAKAQQRHWRLDQARAAEARERSDAHARRQAERAAQYADGPKADPASGEQAMKDLMARLGQRDPTDD